jgi:hypothetical protein
MSLKIFRSHPVIGAVLSGKADAIEVLIEPTIIEFAAQTYGNEIGVGESQKING